MAWLALNRLRPAPVIQATDKKPDIVSASVSDALAALHVTPDAGLLRVKWTHAGKRLATTKSPKKKGARCANSSASSWACQSGCSS